MLVRDSATAENLEAMESCKSVVIYFMKLAGYSYVGRHVVDKPAIVCAGKSGRGGIPGGRKLYYGSGVKWKRVCQKHGRENIRWRIVAVFAGSDQPGWSAGEERLISASQLKHGRDNCNLREGSIGWTSDEMRRIWDNPLHRERMRKVGRESGGLSWRNPASAAKIRAGVSKALHRAWQDPAYRARLSRVRRRQWCNPTTRRGRMKGILQRRLIDAVGRRNAGRPPLPEDGALLAQAGEPPNPLPVASPTEPKRKRGAAVLNALRSGSGTAIEVGTRLGLSHGQVRSAIDKLRRRGWHIVCDADGRFCLNA